MLEPLASRCAVRAGHRCAEASPPAIAGGGHRAAGDQVAPGRAFDVPGAPACRACSRQLVLPLEPTTAPVSRRGRRLGSTGFEHISAAARCCVLRQGSAGWCAARTYHGVWWSRPVRGAYRLTCNRSSRAIGRCAAVCAGRPVRLHQGSRAFRCRETSNRGPPKPEVPVTVVSSGPGCAASPNEPSPEGRMTMTRARPHPSSITPPPFAASSGERPFDFSKRRLERLPSSSCPISQLWSPCRRRLNVLIRPSLGRSP